MNTVRMTIEYDGRRFHGWQIQPDQRTVQGELVAALTTILRTPVMITGAGRTDAGVHARGQVATFRTDATVDPARLRCAVNGITDRDVVVREVALAGDAFDARRSATARHYRYLLAGERTALHRHRAWYPGGTLDGAAIDRAADDLLGSHDFTTFAASQDGSAGKRCHVRRAEFEAWDGGRRFDIEADRFLHHMVRNIVGTLVEIGLGRRRADSIPELLDARDRRRAGPTAPAHALVLWQVRYDG